MCECSYRQTTTKSDVIRQTSTMLTCFSLLRTAKCNPGWQTKMSSVSSLDLLQIHFRHRAQRNEYWYGTMLSTIMCGSVVCIASTWRDVGGWKRELTAYSRDGSDDARPLVECLSSSTICPYHHQNRHHQQPVRSLLARLGISCSENITRPASDLSRHTRRASPAIMHRSHRHPA